MFTTIKRSKEEVEKQQQQKKESFSIKKIFSYMNKKFIKKIRILTRNSISLLRSSLLLAQDGKSSVLFWFVLVAGKGRDPLLHVKNIHKSFLFPCSSFIVFLSLKTHQRAKEWSHYLSFFFFLVVARNFHRLRLHRILHEQN